MPQTTAARGGLRQSLRRRAINDRWRDRLTLLKRKFARAVQTEQTEQARALYVELQSTVDRMARRHILHRNTAARQKSRLAAKLTVPAGAGATE